MSVELARGEARVFMVKKVIPKTKNIDQARRSVHHEHAPRYLDTTAHTGHFTRPSREQHIPSYVTSH